MIFDSVKNITKYNGLGGRFETAFDFISKMDPAAYEPGKTYHIEGDDLRFNIQTVEGKAPDNEMYEAHVKYADIQYIIDGTEYMGWAEIGSLEQYKPVDPQGDIGWYRGNGQMLRFDKGTFAVFFPQDAHMPCRNDGVNPSKSLKLVMKVRI